MPPPPFALRLFVWIPACVLLEAGYAAAWLPPVTAFLLWGLVLGAGLGFHSARLRRWMTRFPTPGYIAGRRQVRLAAAAAWVAGWMLVAQYPPLQPLDLRIWCFSLLESPTIALLHTGGMAATMALAYLLLPPPKLEDKTRQALLRMRWAITILSFTIFYVGLSLSLAFAAPRALPLMITLFITPVAFCLAHDAALEPL